MNPVPPTTAARIRRLSIAMLRSGPTRAGGSPVLGDARRLPLMHERDPGRRGRRLEVEAMYVAHVLSPPAVVLGVREAPDQLRPIAVELVQHDHHRALRSLLQELEVPLERGGLVELDVLGEKAPEPIAPLAGLLLFPRLHGKRCCEPGHRRTSHGWCRLEFGSGMTTRELPTGTLTFFFSDIEGSTRLVQRLGSRFKDLLERHEALVRTALNANGGVEVRTVGDAFFIVFPTADAAVGAAVAAQRAHFVGREREVQEVGALVRAQRLVTLTGPGGTGKTRLSLRVAREVAPEFPQGVFFVPLEPIRDPALVPTAIAEALAIPEEPSRPVT